MTLVPSIQLRFHAALDAGTRHQRVVPAADIIRRAMTRMEDALAEHKLSAQMLLQVHDELIFEVPDDEVAATLPVVQHTMQDAPFPAVLLSVPLHVDARAADNWDEAH